MTPRYGGIRTCRLLVRRQGVLRKVCRLAFDRRDTSLCVIPNGSPGSYRAGEEVFPAGIDDVEIRHGEVPPHEEKLKLSFHEGGQVHVKPLGGGVPIAGPLNAMPLWEYRGDQLALVFLEGVDALEVLPEARPKAKHPEVVLEATGTAECRAFAILANGELPRFAEGVKAVVTMHRPGLSGPLYLGLTTWSFPALKGGGAGAVTVLTGWRPEVGPPGPEQRFLWVRAC